MHDFFHFETRLVLNTFYFPYVYINLLSITVHGAVLLYALRVKINTDTGTGTVRVKISALDQKVLCVVL